MQLRHLIETLESIGEPAKYPIHVEVRDREGNFAPVKLDAENYILQTRDVSCSCVSCPYDSHKVYILRLEP